MTRVLSELLDAKEPAFTFGLQQLEAASGLPGEDIRLTTYILTTTYQKTRELGLDPKDTNGKELYHVLQWLVGQHDNFLVKALGGKDPADVTDLLPRIKAKVEKLPIPKSCWAVKHSVAKRLLKALPPKRIMKQLNYKSVDSLLKREHIGEILGALRFSESPAWLTKFVKSYRQLQPKDFETRNIEIVLLDRERWGELAKPFVQKQRHNLTHLKEMGVISILPLPVDRLPGITIVMLPFLIHYINEVRLYSSYFKLEQVKPDFGDVIVNTLTADAPGAATIAEQPIHWRIIQQYYGRLEKGHHPEVFEPHVQPEDLFWRKAEEVLYRIEPALKFWEGLDYVGAMHDSQVVPLSLIDNAISYCNQLPYGQQAAYHFRDSLWNEIFVRYLGQENLERQVLKQLDNDMVAEDLLLANLEAGA